VATNITVDFLRKEGKTVFSYTNDEQDSLFQGASYEMESSHNPEKVATDRETLSKVAEVIKGLRPNERLIIELLFIKGLPRDRIADMMQTSQGNINTIVHRIRNKIRAILPDV
jgi:RNA polymerase sigma factor (sigma-70 family)